MLSPFWTILQCFWGQIRVAPCLAIRQRNAIALQAHFIGRGFAPLPYNPKTPRHELLVLWANAQMKETWYQISFHGTLLYHSGHFLLLYNK